MQLNGLVTAAVMAGGGRLARAKLQSISVNGGLLRLQHQLSAGDLVEIAFHARSGAIHGIAEMLHPTLQLRRACLQPFRFIALPDDDHRNSHRALHSALSHGPENPVSQPPQSSPLF